MITRTLDADDVKRFLSADGIGEYVGWFDGFEPPMTDDYHYLVVMEGAKKAGLWILHPGEHGAKIHANMLPGFRGEIARRAARDVLKYGFEIADSIYAEIPDKYPNVIKFTREFLKPIASYDRLQLMMLRREQWVS